MAEDLSLTETIYPSLEGRTVFISGGAAGIGSSMVAHFCAQKSKVAFVDINVEAANELVQTITKRGHSAPTFIECDLRNVEKLQATVKQVGRDLGNITVLINNAAHDERHDIAEVTLEYWEDRLAVNMRHIFFATQAAAPQMVEAGEGSIISFGSISWMSAQDDLPAYAASKASVHGLTRGFARYYGKHGIRANTLVPGWIFTERQKELWYSEEGEQVLQIRQCIKDHIQPYEVARMALFLAADDSKMCTAQNFIVDAGWT
jgi:NAD(P)-dependent dehydrogenase (short-subunit alcohol dehydrogenase family)